MTELSLTPGMNVMDGFLTSHLERTFYKHESQLIREYLGAPDDIIDCPTESQRVLFGPKRRRVPRTSRLRDSGKREIDPNDPTMKERYGL